MEIEEESSEVNTVIEQKTPEQVKIPETKVTKKKLEVGFQARPHDKQLPNAPKTLESRQNIPDQVPLDATEALKGFWGMVDMMLVMATVISKGQFEYRKMETKDIDDLAKVSNSNEGMRKLATMDGASAIIVIGYAAAKITPRVKINLKPVHKENDKNCKCTDCEKKRIATIKEPAGTTEIPKEVLKDVNQTHNKDYQEFLQRNLGSKPEDLAKADEHMRKMKEINDGRPKIV